jgi:hypothetical protein
MARLCAPATYERRQPEDSVLYRTLDAHLETFLARSCGEEGGGLPSFVTRELRAYLRCGRLEHGCVHVRCDRCEGEMVVAFSCKGRGFCPSCGGRRMSELAAQLVDRVIPDVPVRQWVLSVPWTLRYQLAFDAGLCTEVLAVFLRVIFGWLKNTAKKQGIRDAQGGAITVVQRFGSALNLNLHLHSLVLDGVYTRPTAEAVPVFHPLPAPTDDEVAKILERVHDQIQKLLRRRGRLPEDPSPTDPVAEPCHCWRDSPLLPSRSAWPPAPVLATRCGAFARRPPWWTRRSPGVRVWRASRSTPMSPCPLTPESHSNTGAAISCARRWPWKG